MTRIPLSPASVASTVTSDDPAKESPNSRANMKSEVSEEPSRATAAKMKSMVNRFMRKRLQRANSDHRPRFTFDEARERGIDLTTIDFATGQLPEGVEPFIRPLAPAKVESMLNHFKPWLRDGHWKDFINDSESLPCTRREEASVLYRLIQYYLTNSQGGGPRILPDHTKWRQFDHSIEHLYRYQRDDIGCDWFVENAWRYTTDPLSKLPDEGMADTTKPHVTCFLTDHVELTDGTINTSELTTVYWLASQAAFLDCFSDQTIFPVTVVSASFRTVRIVQGTVNMRTSAVQLRVSQLVHFPKGIRADAQSWRDFTTLVGWILGEPIGNTKLV